MNALALLQQEEREYVAAIERIDREVEMSTKFGNAPAWNKKWKESQAVAKRHLLNQLGLVQDLIKKLT
jgi:hypothetical protein